MRNLILPMLRHDLYKGRRCLWVFTPRGGYGFRLRVPVTVLEVGRTTVTILVEGRDVTRRVAVSSLYDPPTMIHAKPEVLL